MFNYSILVDYDEFLDLRFGVSRLGYIQEWEVFRLELEKRHTGHGIPNELPKI
jgi:hypothetical protein